MPASTRPGASSWRCPLSTAHALITTAAALLALLAGRASTRPMRRRLTAAYEHAWYLAHTDELTGLPNRRLAHHVLDGLLADHEPTMVILLDLDRFKTVNDTHGHAAGDQLLQQTAARLRTAADAIGATAVRLAGDEFLIIASAGVGHYATVTADVLTRLEQPLTLHPAPGTTAAITPRASAGIAVTTTGAWNRAQLLRHADIALYQAKRSGNWYGLYHDEHHAHAVVSRGPVRLRDMHRTPTGHGQVQP